MDPLSLTASLLAVIGAAKAGANGVRKLSNYRKAPREVADLLSELESFLKILAEIKLFTELCPDVVFSKGLYEQIQLSALKIAAINNLVASTPFKLSRLSDDIQARIVWVRYKQTLLKLRDDLQVLRMDLVLRLGLVKAISSCGLEESLSVSLRAQKEISDQLSALIGTMKPSTSLQNQPSSTSLALELTGGGARVDSPNSKSSFDQARTGKVAMESLPAGSSKLGEHSLSHQSALVQKPPPIVIKQQCTTLCSCAYHARSIVKSPWILETIIGKITVQYTGRGSTCNEIHCRSALRSSFKVVFHFPKYIMNRYLSVVMQYAPLSGPELLLRIPRTVSWSHLLWNYANNGDLLAIQRLFAEGRASPYDLNPQGTNALVYAANRDHSELIKFLLKQGVDPEQLNDIGRTPSDVLWEKLFAGTFGSEGTGVVESMLGDTAPVRTQAFSTLHKMVLGSGSKDLESELKKSTVGINVGDSKNRTSLCWATIRNDFQAVKTLLAFGADPNIVDKWGHTLLDFARSTGICKMLLDAGVNIHTSNMDYGRSALHNLFQITGGSSLQSETVDMIDLLINAGLDVNVRDSDGETPLLNAVFSGHASHVRRLLELGADPNVSNQSSRESAIHFAVSFDRHDMIPLLLEHGADYTAINARGSNIAHMAAWSAGTKTISVLADSNLVNLDLSLRNKDGKTPANYLSERSVLTESEQGLHAAFARFLKSIPVPIVDTIERIPRTSALRESSDACDNLHLPGAYPAFAEPSESF